MYTLFSMQLTLANKRAECVTSISNKLSNALVYEQIQTCTSLTGLLSTDEIALVQRTVQAVISKVSTITYLLCCYQY
jgi:hypothetical protein